MSYKLIKIVLNKCENNNQAWIIRFHMFNLQKNIRIEFRLV